MRMSCTNPSLLEVLNIPQNVPRIGILERLEKFGYKFNQEKTKAYRFATKDSQKLKLESIDDWITQKVIELPCGSCLACRIDYSQDWAVRCQFEAQLWQYNYFLTLSYDDDHLPIGDLGNPTLVKQDIKDFIKALRNYFSHRGFTGIRYILCGEYNTSGERILNPHYHIILFNCPIPDLTIDFPTPDGGVIHKLNGVKLPMFYSPLIADIWDKGFIAIDDANFNTEAYVSRYILKKQKGESSETYSKGLGVVPPFLLMSNRPGIGYNMFLRDRGKYVIDPTIILSGRQKPLVVGLPKYFKRKLFEVDPSLRDKFEDVAKQNELRNRSIRAANLTTSNDQKASLDLSLKSRQSIFSRNNSN